MRSMNGSRRNSGSSLVSSSSASSNLSHLEEDTWILWGRIANEWEEWRRRKEKLLKVAGPVGLGGAGRVTGPPEGSTRVPGHPGAPCGQRAEVEMSLARTREGQGRGAGWGRPS